MYLQATVGGLRLARWLRRIGTVDGMPVQVPDSGFAYLDRHSTRHWHTELEALRAARDLHARPRPEWEPLLARLSPYGRAIATTNVLKDWVTESIHLSQDMAQWAAASQDVPMSHVTVIGQVAPLAQLLDRERSGGPVVRSQATLRSAAVYVGAALLVALGELLRGLFAGRSTPYRPARIGVTAQWGTRLARANDLYWWWDTAIDPARLLYLLDTRESFRDSVEQVGRLGIPVVAVGTWLGPPPAPSLPRAAPPWSDALKDFTLVASLTRSVLTSARPRRHALASLAWRHMTARRLASQFRAAGVRAVFHHQETQADCISQAAELAGGIRLGAQWASLAGPCGAAVRTHHAFFCWGTRDARIYTDSGSTVKHLLIAGCPMVEVGASPAARAVAQCAVDALRAAGARIILALFDTNFTPDFYSAFLRWAIECPDVGLLIKSKWKGWARAKADGLDGLVHRALSTSRVVALADDSSPAVVAQSADFAVGCVSPSAVIVSALAGARVLFIDYEGVDRGPLKPYAAFHSLGPGRCVFSCAETLRVAVEQYLDAPAAHQCLGDATPILDQLDPFRDGQASRRIGDYVAWYLTGLDAGLSSDSAVARATRRYADTWGEDKAVRGLECQPDRKLSPQASPS